MHAVGNSFAASHRSDLTFHGVWTQAGEYDAIVLDDDDDDTVVVVVPGDTTNNANKKGKPSKKKQMMNNGKKHWRMLKRRHDFIDTETKQVIANISDFLDFAIIGNPKTGTTFLVEWLNRHPDLYLPDREMRHLLRPDDGPALLVEQFMYLYRRKKGRKQLAYKCPADIRDQTALTHLRDYFPNTKLIVGLRHPVWWFQSFYNYRIREERPIPGPHECRGPCEEEHIATCTYNAYFHLHLAQMGQTARTEPEKLLLRHYDPQNDNQPLPYDLAVLNPPAPHSVFLYDQNQIDGRKVPEIAETFRRDMSAYLGVSPMLPSLQQATQLTYENRTETAQEKQTRKLIESKLINICNPEFQHMRNELVKVGSDAADWILNYYMPLPNVHVSSPDYFRKVLEEYKSDPCLKNKVPALYGDVV